MPESRDRLIREHPFTPMSGQRSTGGIWQDLQSERSFQFSNSRFGNVSGRNLFGSPLQMRPIAMPAVSMRRIGYGTPRQNLFGNRLIEQENRLSTGNGRRGRGRVRNSPLPYWYPRAPLRDITAAVDRRTHLREAERRRFASSLSLELSTPGSNLRIAGSPLKYISLTSPNPMTAVKCCPSSVRQMLLANHIAGESDFLTPQKKLLDSIDRVEKVVMDEFQRMKRTPRAKKVERENKVRTLMSMR